jgi:hypothetical protein
MHDTMKLYSRVQILLHDPTALPPGKDPPVPTEQEAGWTPGPVWTLSRKENYLVPAGNPTPEIQPAVPATPIIFRIIPVLLQFVIKLRNKATF